jgi:hypothetical protein
MARSSVAAAMSFWLARGGVFGLLTSKSALMCSRAYFPSSRARSPRAEASPAMEARSSRTARYSSASLASSSRAWVSCVFMSEPLVAEVGARSAPGSVVRWLPSSGGLLRRQPLRVRAVGLVVDDHHEALTCRVVASGAGVVGVAEPVVRGVEEPLEHH